jgi:hypothetical protein
VLPLRDNVPTRSPPVVTLGLIAANAAVWIWELRGTPVELDIARDGFYPCSVHGPCITEISQFRELHWYESVFMSMFMHASWSHILGNMLFLWIFGNNVEDSFGKLRFLIWYLCAGVAATATQAVVTLLAGTGVDAGIPNIGASGAIAAVLGAYIVLLPRARVLTLIVFFLREIPAVWFLGIWIALQVWSGGASFLTPQHSGGTAFFAHIGGFVFGLLTVNLVAQRRPLQPSW